jgi:divalent metal cation (Fe/Co/Zn/Cd) transporter
MNDSQKKRALILEYFTVGYNVIEGIVSIIAGLLSGSIALIGFGLDSAIESISGAILIWRLLKHGKISAEEEARVEQQAVRLVGISFYVLGAYIFIISVRKLYLHDAPEPSLLGIIIAILSLIIMPALAYMKYSLGKKTNMRSLIADSKQTFICAILSVALLVGLLLNYLFGLWWADPISALVIVFFIIMEGYKTLKSSKLCCC